MRNTSRNNRPKRENLTFSKVLRYNFSWWCSSTSPNIQNHLGCVSDISSNKAINSFFKFTIDILIEFKILQDEASWLTTKSKSRKESSDPDLPNVVHSSLQKRGPSTDVFNHRQRPCQTYLENAAKMS